MRVSKQWTDEGRTARKSGSGPRNVTSAREDRRLVRMAQTDRTAFSRQLAAQWSTATRVSLCASSIRRHLLQRGLRARIPLCRIPLTQNHRRLRLHWANVHRSWRADWQQVVFSDKSPSICGTMMAEFVSGSMPVNGAFRSALSNATVDEHPELWSGVP
ncbi:transposable element Tc1 transposase [Trichonephila clavipes]|nr:transposable element Tc1 transposase [Trichonephila clavipes]